MVVCALNPIKWEAEVDLLRVEVNLVHISKS